MLFRKRQGKPNQTRTASYSDYVNVPLKFDKDGKWWINERLVELLFVHKHLDLEGAGKRLLEFGCTRSLLSLEAAALGYDVVGVDLRDYSFAHPTFNFHLGNLMEYEADAAFDVITAISVLEHIGLGAYGESKQAPGLEEVIARIVVLLKPGGRFIATLPVGIPSEDDFLRSFSPEGFKELFAVHGLDLADERYFMRLDGRSWLPCDADQCATVSNTKIDRGFTGVNGVGCFLWEQPSQ